ncbi:UDP-2,4-diacetamido-2,4,6-trideoxy-beta-L-altropyranose hydrolase [Kluyvera ascorbata]|uniref:UDP-2,4-diacetamido-2,4, 6-trideoxy-beta-L-altropyranose hydrolase n=1 Tax=Kluyvera ascorbata TaxID=51288 RepID=UPI00374D98D1
MDKQRHCIIRVDASTWIGTGHFYRCLNLAIGFMKCGYKVTFLCRYIPSVLVSILAKHKIEMIELVHKNDLTNGEENIQCPHGKWLHLSYQSEILESTEVIKNYLANNKLDQLDVILIDHYAIEQQWQNKIKCYSRLLVQIDDLADRCHATNLLVDQNFFRNLSSRYENLVDKSVDLLLGPSYALLNHKFALLKENLQHYSDRYENGWIVVFFGGVDYTNETEKAIDGLLSCIDSRITLDVILGGTNPHQQRLKNKYYKNENVHINVQVDNMAERLARSFLFVGAIGSTTWERCTLAVPAIVVSVAENQNDLASSLQDYRSHLFIGQMNKVTEQDYAQAYNNLSFSELQIMSDISANLTDGLGVERVINKVEEYLK